MIVTEGDENLIGGYFGPKPMLFKVIGRFSAGKSMLTAGYFPRFPAIIYIPVGERSRGTSLALSLRTILPPLFEKQVRTFLPSPFLAQ